MRLREPWDVDRTAIWRLRCARRIYIYKNMEYDANFLYKIIFLLKIFSFQTEMENNFDFLYGNLINHSI